VSGGGAEIKKKLGVAADLRGVVRTMKAMAAASIGGYERAAAALLEYDLLVQFGLGAVLRLVDVPLRAPESVSSGGALNIIVFGSDQGLVGQFNETIAEYAVADPALRRKEPVVWAVGARVHALLSDAGLAMQGLFMVPNDVTGIAALVGELELRTAGHRIHDADEALIVFHNVQSAGTMYQPAGRRLLPLDAAWRTRAAAKCWPGKIVPEILGGREAALRALIREHIFISLYRAAAESLVAENASRLAAMQRAEKNIGELSADLTRRFHRARQTGIDEELFDVVSGFDCAN
jgi:F-type H+-transporting ATPase subunit gamma